MFILRQAICRNPLRNKFEDIDGRVPGRHRHLVSAVSRILARLTLYGERSAEIMNLEKFGRTALKTGLLLFHFSLFSPSLHSQKVAKCKVKNKDAAKLRYFVGRTESVEAREGDPSGVLVNIAIKSDQFKRDYLIVLATNLKNRFCNEELLLVNIFDNKQIAASPPSLMFRSLAARSAFRGANSLNRRSDEEIISFVQGPDFNGNPDARIQIDLKALR